MSSLIDSSRSWAGETRDGASVMTHVAFCVLGKAITSRMDVAPVRMAVSRSRPKARPPWGGAPNSSASSKNPNFFLASSALIFRRPNVCDWTSRNAVRAVTLSVRPEDVQKLLLAEQQGKLKLSLRNGDESSEPAAKV